MTTEIVVTVVVSIFFAGISGSGDLRVRSPIRALISDMGAGAMLRVGAGLAVIKDLKYRIP